MATRRTVRSGKRSIVLPAAALLVTAYFSWHAYHGAHGLLARDDLQREELRLSAELKGLVARREALERDIMLLRPDSLDPDYLEQRAIELLNFTHPDIRELKPAR